MQVVDGFGMTSREGFCFPAQTAGPPTAFGRGSPQTRDKTETLSGGHSELVLDVVVGLGTNLEPRLANISTAVDHLRNIKQASVESISTIYETKAVGPVQPDYLNAAVRLTARTDLLSFFHELYRVELAMGRPPREARVPWGPRVIDLDILWARDIVFQHSVLSVPHSGLHARAFALAPLLDVAPELRPIWQPVLDSLGGPPQIFAKSL